MGQAPSTQKKKARAKAKQAPKKAPGNVTWIIPVNRNKIPVPVVVPRQQKRQLYRKPSLQLISEASSGRVGPVTWGEFRNYLVHGPK